MQLSFFRDLRIYELFQCFILKDFVKSRQYFRWNVYQNLPNWIKPRQMLAKCLQCLASLTKLILKFTEISKHMKGNMARKTITFTLYVQPRKTLLGRLPLLPLPPLGLESSSLSLSLSLSSSAPPFLGSLFAFPGSVLLAPWVFKDLEKL